MPSLAAAVGIAGFAFGFAPARSAALLLLDGLGSELLARFRGDAPVLSELAQRSRAIAAGFPATTATSVSAIGTGQHAGAHGVVSYSFLSHGACGETQLMNALRWSSRRSEGWRDLRDVVVPEAAQPEPTILERAAAAGVAVARVMPALHACSGLSRAVLRGTGTDVAADDLGALAEGILRVLRAPGRSLSYSYYGQLDWAGHLHGPGSAQWRRELQSIDRMVARVAEEMPVGALLAVVADHGMVDTGSDVIDIDTTAALCAGVRWFGGESRVRFLYSEPGAARDVYAAWKEVLGERAWVVERDEAIERGWFGPTVTAAARARLGDVIAAARDCWTLARSQAEPLESRFIGHHGSWTPAEQLVPLIPIRRD
jgi:predicted AlkP superfamily pyrophosphatase or phosphodiesterase